MSPSDVSQATLPSTRNFACVFHRPSSSEASRLWRSSAFRSYAAIASGTVRGGPRNVAHDAVVHDLAGVAELARQQPDEIACRRRARVGAVVALVVGHRAHDAEEPRLLGLKAFLEVLADVLHDPSSTLHVSTAQTPTRRLAFATLASGFASRSTRVAG